ncbi:MAG TPA: HPr family phosphocarrier protein [Gemmatimonadales bacterium]|jgi:phosphocarrier protein|nr:HPr family phosphocarrier protein [Gemmatimonadales bacterium]
MTERIAQIVNSQGLHARPAALIVKLAGTFGADITLGRHGEEDGAVNAKSIMGVMMLAAECGSAVVIRAHGTDEEAAASALADLIAGGFGES